MTERRPSILSGLSPERSVMTLTGKKGLVLGVANKRSLAWAIAKRASEAGAELALDLPDGEP